MQALRRMTTRIAATRRSSRHVPLPFCMASQPTQCPHTVNSARVRWGGAPACVTSLRVGFPLQGKLATIADHRDPFHTKDIEAGTVHRILASCHDGRTIASCALTRLLVHKNVITVSSDTRDCCAEFNAHRTTVLADDVGHDWDHTKDANAVNSAFQSQHTDYNEKLV